MAHQREENDWSKFRNNGNRVHIECKCLGCKFFYFASVLLAIINVIYLIIYLSH